MATIKCNKPDEEDKGMLDRWISFHDVKITETDRVEIQIDELLKEMAYIFLREYKDGYTKEKFWITRIVLSDSKNTHTIIYSELPVFVMEDGKTVDRIN